MARALERRRQLYPTHTARLRKQLQQRNGSALLKTALLISLASKKYDLPSAHLRILYQGMDRFPGTSGLTLHFARASVNNVLDRYLTNWRWLMQLAWVLLWKSMQYRQSDHDICLSL